MIYNLKGGSAHAMLPSDGLSIKRRVKKEFLDVRNHNSFITSISPKPR
jgi:hypothetical protein